MLYNTPEKATEEAMACFNWDEVVKIASLLDWSWIPNTDVAKWHVRSLFKDAWILHESSGQLAITATAGFQVSASGNPLDGYHASILFCPVTMRV